MNQHVKTLNDSNWKNEIEEQYIIEVLIVETLQEYLKLLEHDC